LSGLLSLSDTWISADAAPFCAPCKHKGTVVTMRRENGEGQSELDLTDPASRPWSLPATAPLAERMRPRELHELLGQDHLTVPGAPLHRLLNPENAAPSSVIVWGPPGTGKTSFALLAARRYGANFVELSATSAGVADLRRVVEQARVELERGRGTLLFVDEVHRFSKAQQDALLPAVERGWVTLVAATTENPSFSVIAPLLSRSLLVTLTPLGDRDIAALLERACTDERGLGSSVTLSDDAVESLLRYAGGDARRALTALEASAAACNAAGSDILGTEHVSAAVAQVGVLYDRAGDQHYDVISAFIKSLRGSDADAALHYLARMIVAGEDPRYIARRLVVHATEDVGLADPTALHTAVAAAQSVALLGMPEARLALAQATVHIALAPKSNSVYAALEAAVADVQRGRIGVVPTHLRDAHYAGAARLGHGVSYEYPHDHPGAVVVQQYLPDELRSARYYRPNTNGRESFWAERWNRLRGFLRGLPTDTTTSDEVQTPER
jgi:putative ATPase